MLKSRIKDAKAFLISAIIFSIILASGGYFIHLSNDNYIQGQRLLLGGTARSQASDLERSLSLAFTSTQILAHQIEVDQSRTERFESYAKNILESIGGIANIQLAPDGVIRYIFPLAGNEGAIGLDVLHNPKYKEAAQLAIKERKMIAVGPVELVQGGTAVIGRTPIFTKSPLSGDDVFWGFASALIMLEDLLHDTGIHNLESEGYAISLERQHKDSKNHLTFYQSESPLDPNTKVQAEITLPSGSWILSMSHKASGNVFSRTLNMALITLLIASITACGLYVVLIRPLELQQEVNKKTEELKELAYKDVLTGLPNRRYLNDLFPQILNEIISQRRLGAFIYFDLDNFKSINDSIGHDIGDQVLTEISKRLTQTKDADDQVIRLGGDEFAIIVTNAKSLNHIIKKARAILECTQEAIHIQHRELRQSTSLGITLIPKHGSQTLELMQCADVALYEAKRLGKNQYAIFNEDMRKASIDNHEKEIALNIAIQEEQLELYFQPQIDLSLNRIIGAEALVRWNHPEQGLVFPDQFIPLAEQSGLILELGNYVIRKSFEYLNKRQKLGLYPILLHINLSSLQLSDPKLVPFVKKMIKTYSIPGHYIGFEITETTLLTDLKQAQKTLEALKSLGICIAIDDFGTGFSSLGQLKNLPVDLLKIDRSFVRDLEEDKDDRMMVEAIIAMAHKLNILVIAEGVEVLPQLSMLKEFQCDLGQGYLVSRPIPESQFNTLSEDMSSITATNQVSVAEC